MLSAEEISERNSFLINVLAKLQLGIHVVELPHKPKMLSHDYKYWLHGYVKNFKLILKPAEYTEEVFYEFRLKKEYSDEELEAIREKFVEWMSRFEHKRVYTLSNKHGMFVVGFNHNDKINKKQPYPVFAEFEPLIYFDLARAESVKERFSEYELIVA